MDYKIVHQTRYAYSEAVPVCHNLIHLSPRELVHQACNEFKLLIHPEPFEVVESQDFCGNQVAYFLIDQAHLGLTVTSTSRVSVTHPAVPVSEQTPPWETVANDLKNKRTTDSLAAYQFVFPSPYIQPFGGLADYARPSFAVGRPILSAVLELTGRIHKDFKFDSRVTTIHTPLTEVFEKRHGVCQDFAHLQIGCLRAMGLSARYVSGYLRTEPPAGKPRLVGADASHAWVSVYCGEAGWIDVDPTNNMMIATDHVTVAWGRDYYDVCPIQGVIIGGGEHRMSVSVDVEPLTS